MALKIILNEEAYQGMVHQALQLYKQESFGYVIGKRIKRKKTFDYETLAKASIPTRIYPSYDSINQDLETYNRAISFFRRTSLDIIGDFHSHTDFSKRVGKITLSDEDINNIKMNGRYFFSFVLGIKESEAKNVGLMIKNKEIIYVDDFYYGKAKNKKRRLKIRMVAFYLEKSRKKDKEPTVIQAEIEPSSYLLNWINKFSLNKRKKPRSIETLESIAESIDNKEQQED